MNSCVLMAEVIQDPQLRYTQDNNLAIAEMTVQFSGIRDDEPVSQMKVIGWGNMAQEIQEKYHTGDRVILEGRLGMISVDRPEGFKEKRAELTVQRIHLLGEGESFISSSSASDLTGTGSSTATTPQFNNAPAARSTAPSPPPAERKVVAAKSAPAKPAYSAPPEEVDYDEIPF